MYLVCHLISFSVRHVKARFPVEAHEEPGLPLYPTRALLQSAAHHLLASTASYGYTGTMNVEWDEQKNQINIRKHGFSFADAWEMFEVAMLVELDDREDYGEERWVGIGLIQTRTVVVIYTEPDDETLRIISLRKALNHERQAYAQYIKD